MLRRSDANGLLPLPRRLAIQAASTPYQVAQVNPATVQTPTRQFIIFRSFSS
ncbi:hypothetical protein GZL_00188 [Streptomyces sp. 769]|nr:hypothetical protein GZL_00188 [Streptomyces sp. 769]